MTYSLGTMFNPLMIQVQREVLSANRTYFVRSDGNDNNNGLVNSSSGAFATIQKAINTTASLDISIYDVTITIVGNLTITASTTIPITLKDPLSSGGQVYIQGSTSVATDTVLSCSIPIGLDGSPVIYSGFTKLYIIRNLQLSVTQNSNYCYGILIENQSRCQLSNVRLSITGNNGNGILALIQGNSLAQMENMTISGTPDRAIVVGQNSSLIYANLSTLTVTSFTVGSLGHLYIDNSYARFFNTTLSGISNLISTGINYAVLVKFSTPHTTTGSSSNYIVQ